MTFPATHQYMTVIGDAYGGNERWQFGLRLSNMPSSNEQVATALSVPIQRFFMSVNPPYASGSVWAAAGSHRLTELKVARILPDGSYPPTEAAFSFFFVPALQTANGQPAGQTPQDTVAVTLTTPLPRGLASKGRIYLPPGRDYLPASDGLLPVSNATNIAKAVKILINEINASPEAGEVSIFSRGKAHGEPSPDGKKIIYTYPNVGAVQLVSGVRVGRVVDTQRRRRRALNELPIGIPLLP